MAENGFDSIRARWLGAPGREQTASIIRSIRKNLDLRNLPFVQVHDGRLDLRGFAFPSSESIGEIRVQGRAFAHVRGKLALKRANLSHCDLSYADFADTSWEYGAFANVSLRRSNMSGVSLWACKFDNVSFDHADLRDFHISNHGDLSCEFHRCTFKRARFGKLVGGFNIFEGCHFDNADLRSTDFDGNRFRHCRFSGLVDDTMFHKHARFVSTPMLPWTKADPRRFTNEMSNIDFRDATLRSVTFDAIDLSSCVFPDDGNHLLIHNQHLVFCKAYEIVSRQWKYDKTDRLLKSVDALYITPRRYSPLTLEQTKSPLTLVNRLDFNDRYGQALGDRLFELIKSLSDKQQGLR